MEFQYAYIASLASVFDSLGTPIPLTNIVIFSITESTRRLDALDTEVYDDSISTSKLDYSGREMDRSLLDGLKREEEILSIGQGSEENNNRFNLPTTNQEKQQHYTVESFQQKMDSSASNKQQHLLRSR